jgi:mannosyltransferase OCH1-like enzyme
LTEAIGHFRQALQKNPYHSGAAWALAQLHLLTLDLQSAREYLRMHMQIETSGRTARGMSSNQTQSQIGQLLDEYVLERSALAEMVALRGYPPQDRVGPLRAIAERFPDYTPAAMTLLTAMRQAGHFAHPSSFPTEADALPIPPRIIQYWDAAEVPPDVRRLMASWRQQHPGYEFRLFDNRAARAFLGGNFAPVVLHAYDRVRGPAQKADIFRVAWLLMNGGYYVDADDGCLSPVEAIAPPGCRLLLYQEEYGTIGNNFMGVAPGHPVMRLALDAAVRAINRGDSDFVWLSTGPGLLTRAFVQHLLQSDRQRSIALNGIVILDRRELHKAVAVHCRAAYKQTVRHWGHAAFQHKTPAGGARVA